MKFTIYDLRFTICAPRPPPGSAATAPRASIVNHQSSIVNERAFTMMEIAICLAIISFALVVIIGVLPLGMNTQRDVREATLINQDATVLLEAIRSGGQGGTDLANYVYAITNEATGVGYDQNYLSSNRRIIGLLSTRDDKMVAYVRSMSGLAAEKPPQNNSIVLDDSFSYRVVCVNVPVPGGRSALQDNLHELRLTFLWPQRPNGSVGNGRQTFRATIAGQLSRDGSNTNLWFYQPQTFKAP